MIDTIALTLTSNLFKITQPEKFKPSAAWILADQSRASSTQSKQNPSKKELTQGVYKPRLTLSKRISHTGGREIMLKIELSLPKLMFGNNFDELRLKDFMPIVSELVDVLSAMGVIVDPLVLAQAPVAAIHYSKNIALTDGSTPHYFINKIKEANIKLSLDVNQTQYRNDGHSYRWHCNSYEVAFYDKIRELEIARQSSKRSMEKDSALQLSMLNRFRERKMLEILRMEVRLNKRDKMKHLFKKMGIKNDLTFKSLFKPTIAKKVLLHYLDELESRRPLLLDYRPTSERALMADLIFNNPDLNAKQIFQLFGLRQALNYMTLRELRAMLSRGSKRGWYRLMGLVNKVKLPTAQDPFVGIRKSLVAFKPLNLGNYKIHI